MPSLAKKAKDGDAHVPSSPDANFLVKHAQNAYSIPQRDNVERLREEIAGLKQDIERQQRAIAGFMKLEGNVSFSWGQVILDNAGLNNIYEFKTSGKRLHREFLSAGPQYSQQWPLMDYGFLLNETSRKDGAGMKGATKSSEHEIFTAALPSGESGQMAKDGEGTDLTLAKLQKELIDLYARSANIGNTRKQLLAKSSVLRDLEIWTSCLQEGMHLPISESSVSRGPDHHFHVAPSRGVEAMFYLGDPEVLAYECLLQHLMVQYKKIKATLSTWVDEDLELLEEYLQKLAALEHRLMNRNHPSVYDGVHWMLSMLTRVTDNNKPSVIQDVKARAAASKEYPTLYHFPTTLGGTTAQLSSIDDVFNHLATCKLKGNDRITKRVLAIEIFSEYQSKVEAEAQDPGFQGDGKIKNHSIQGRTPMPRVRFSGSSGWI